MSYWDIVFGGAGYQKEGIWYTRNPKTEVYQKNSKYAFTGEASLWGKVKPVTYGTRRIMGQLLQIGNQRMEETTKEFVTGASTGGGRTAGGGWSQTYVSHESRVTDVKYISTFAYCFGEPGNPTSKQNLTKIWIDKTLVYDHTQGMLATNFRFYFYDGNENQIPDAELNRDRYDYPVGYRGLMYIVFYDFTLGHNPGGNPIVEAEFVETLSNTQTVTTYTGMGGTGTNFHSRGIMYDPKKDMTYVVGENNRIYKYDCATKTLIDHYPITGYTISGTSGFVFSGAWTNCLTMFRLGGTLYFLCTMTFGNTAQLFLIDADTGITAASYGTNSSGLTPGPDAIQYARAASVINTTDGYSITTQVVLTDIFDTVYKFRIGNGQFDLLDFQTGIANVDHAVLASDAEGVVAYVADGTTIARWSSGLYQSSWWTGLYKVVALFALERDKSLVIFEASGANWRIVKVRRSTLEVVWSFDQSTNPEVRVSTTARLVWQSQSYTSGQRISWAFLAPNEIYTLDMLAGQLTHIQNDTALDWSDAVFDSYNNKFIRPTTSAGNGGLEDFHVFGPNTGSITLESLLRDLARRAGYQNANVTVQGITDSILGAAFTEIENVDSVFEELAFAYNFEVIKRGPKISFIRRGYGDLFNPDMISIESKRAILSSSNDEYITIKSERAPIQKAAGTIQLIYIDPAYDYTATEYKYTRNDSQSDPSVVRTIELPIIMTGSQAATLATRILLNASIGRMEHEFRLPQEYLALEKGDVVELVTAEFVDYVRVNEISYNGDWSISVRSEAVLTSSASPVTVPDPVLPPKPPPMTDGEGQAVIFDTPLLDPADQAPVDKLEVYLGMVPANRRPVTTGVILKYYETDGPYSAGTTTIPLTYGSLRTPLTGTVMQIDYLATIQFRMIQGDGAAFQTDTALNMLAGSNRVLIGRPGRWEMVGFIEASYDSASRLVTLTGLCRGLRGTDYAADLHEASDLVVLYERDGSILLDSDLPDLLDKPVIYVTAKPSGEVNTEDSVAYYSEGNTRKPWRPYNVHVVNSSGDLTITWQRRTRLSGPLLNGTGAVPLDEANESYDLVLYRAGNIVRTVPGLTSPTFTYTTSMQSTDGWGGSVTQLQLDVYQNSALVGRGFPMSGAFDVE